MKKIISVILLSVCCITLSQVQAQCVKPTPMTAQQVQKILGKWAGTYTYKGVEQKIVIDIIPLGKSSTEVMCKITNPPLPGKETECEYFFCGGGEFHLKKYIDDIAYVFQGTPENGRMKGILSIYTSPSERTQGGNFVLEKM